MTGERVERRLAAVLAADVAGYSRLMGRDEERTLADLKTVVVGGGAQFDLDKAQFESAVRRFSDQTQGADIGTGIATGDGACWHSPESSRFN